MVGLKTLLVDDAADDRALVTRVLQQADPECEIKEARTAAELTALLERETFDVVISDYNILGYTGLDVLAQIKKYQPTTPVILLTGTGSEEVAVAAMKEGAADYVIKSIKHIKKLPATITAVLSRAALEREKASLIDNLRLSESRYRALVEVAPDAIVSINADGEITFFSRTAEKMFGYAPGEVVGRPVAAFVPPPAREAFATALRQGRVGRRGRVPPIITTTLTRRDGTEFPAEVSYAPFHDDRGVGFTLIVRDITEKRRREEERERLGRMAAVGEMTAAVAHEVRNPLAAIATSAAVTRQELARAGLATNGPDWILQAVRKVEFLLARFFDFAKPLEPEKELLNLAAVAREVVAGEVGLAGGAITVTWEVDDAAAEVYADRALVASVVRNLVSNAREAMPTGGTIRISITAADEGHARLVVADSGAGMPPDVVARALEPFFTTKKNGLGLGLAFVYKIVKAHGGDMVIRSREGGGTEVVITLPRRER